MEKISIIISSFNKEKYIAETIQSVLHQTHNNWELLIVDDCSTDNSIEIISSYLTDNRIKLISNQQNKGANFCRNLGLKNATGSYIVFLDSDDLLVDTCLENRFKKTNEYPDGNLFVFAMGVFQKKVGDDTRNWIPKSSFPLRDFLQHELPWSILQPMWKKDFILSLNGFDENFERLQDVELHTRALLNPEIKYYQFAETQDCYYRVDEERKNFNTFSFLKKWMHSAVKYCNKFEKEVPVKYKRYLFGTFLKSYQQIIYDLKLKRITINEFNELQNILFSSSLYLKAGILKKKILKLSYLYNLSAVRVPGINKALLLLIIT